MPRRSSIQSLPADWPRITQLVFFVLGCLTPLAFAPFGWYLLAPLLPIPLLFLCLTLSPGDAGKSGFWFGFGMFLCGTYWIYISVVVFGQAPVWIAVVLMMGLALIMSAYFWLTAWLTCRLARGEPWLLLAAAPAVWVLAEWLRGWVLTGFPWLSLGYSQSDSPLAGWAPVAGVYGVSALLVMTAAALLVSIMTRGAQRYVALAVACLPWISGAVLRTATWTEEAGEPITVTLIQGGISQDRKWLPEQFRPTLDFYRGQTLSVPDSDLVVWPEVAVPSITDRVANFIAAIEVDARRAGNIIAFGILERGEERSGEAVVHNSFLAVGGPNRQVYRKRHLVPFGEYFPVPDTVREWMRLLSLPHSDLSPGAAAQPLIELTGGGRLAVAICYEDAYGSEQLYALPDAGMLVNISNDAWFGDSIAPDQHLQIARMRSMEVERPTVRATNTGISAFIGADGTLRESGPQFQPVTMTMDVQPRSGSTPYAAMGNLPIIGICLLLVGGLWLRFRAS